MYAVADSDLLNWKGNKITIENPPNINEIEDD
jgi:hypothetical protein